MIETLEHLLARVLKVLTPPVALALLFGFAFGLIVSEPVFDRVDEMFYKGLAEELRKYYNDSKASREHCETELADINAKYKVLEDERNKLQSSYDNRDQFINFLRSSPARSCDKEFVVYNLHFKPEEWDVEDGSIKLYNNEYENGYKLLEPGKPIIVTHNNTYTRIFLEKSRNRCKITFSLATD